MWGRSSLCGFNAVFPIFHLSPKNPRIHHRLRFLFGNPEKFPSKKPKRCAVTMTTAARATTAVLLLFLVQFSFHPLQAYVTPCSSFIENKDFPSTMRRRGGGGSVKAAAMADSKVGDMPPESQAQVKLRENLDSMKFCYKYALIAGVVGITTTLLEVKGSTAIDDLDLYAKLGVTLHQFIFGLGVYRAWRFSSMFTSDAKYVTPSALSDSARNSNRLWKLTTLVVTLGATALSTTLPFTLPVQPWRVVAGLAVVGCIPLYMFATRASQTADANGKPPATSEFEKARQDCFDATREMLVCSGSFAILGMVQICASLSSNGLVAKGFGLLDVAESFAFVKVLSTLFQSTLQTVVSATSASDLKITDYVEQYNAEKAFYEKIGEVFRTQAALKVLTYVIAALKSLVL